MKDGIMEQRIQIYRYNPTHAAVYAAAELRLIQMKAQGSHKKYSEFIINNAIEGNMEGNTK